MKDDYRPNLPTVRRDYDPDLDFGVHAGNPLVPRNPLTAIFRWIGDGTAERSLDSQARLVTGLTRLLEEQTKAVEANDRLHTATEKFHANRLGLLNPADKERVVEEQHGRLLAETRREKELLDARLAALELRHRLEATAAFRDQKFAAGAARFAQKIAERQVGEAVARSGMEPEPKETPAPEKPVSIAAVIMDYVQTLEREIDAAEAAGKPTKQMRDDLAALTAMLKRM